MEAPDFALPPGTLLGNYKLLKVLGRGGFGITYIAWDNQLRRNIVLKECFPLGLCFLAEGIHGCPVGVPGCVR